MSKTTQLILNDEQLNIAVQDIATQLEMAVEWLRGEVEILREALVHIRSIDSMEFGAVATNLLNALEREMQEELQAHRNRDGGAE